MKRIARAAWGPSQVETVPQARERAAPSLDEGLPAADNVRQESGQKRTDGPAFFGRDDARFAEQVGVDSQCHFGLHAACCAIDGAAQF
jgi:hypothetical protein